MERSNKKNRWWWVPVISVAGAFVTMTIDKIVSEAIYTFIYTEVESYDGMLFWANVSKVFSILLGYGFIIAAGFLVCRKMTQQECFRSAAVMVIYSLAVHVLRMLSFVIFVMTATITNAAYDMYMGMYQLTNIMKLPIELYSLYPITFLFGRFMRYGASDVEMGSYFYWLECFLPFVFVAFAKGKLKEKSSAEDLLEP